MNNNMPQIQAYQAKMTEARLHGNPYESKLKLFIFILHCNSSSKKWHVDK